LFSCAPSSFLACRLHLPPARYCSFTASCGNVVKILFKKYLQYKYKYLLKKLFNILWKYKYWKSIEYTFTSLNTIKVFRILKYLNVQKWGKCGNVVVAYDNPITISSFTEIVAYSLGFPSLFIDNSPCVALPVLLVLVRPHKVSYTISMNTT